MRFLVDENLPSELHELLTSSGHDSLYISTSRYRSSSDEALWALAVEDQRVIVTRDLDFPLRSQQRDIPGLVLIRVPDTYVAGQIATVMRAFMETMDLEHLLGRVTVVSPGRSRSRPLRDTN